MPGTLPALTAGEANTAAAGGFGPQTDHAGKGTQVCLGDKNACVLMGLLVRAPAGCYRKDVYGLHIPAVGWQLAHAFILFSQKELCQLTNRWSITVVTS